MENGKLGAAKITALSGGDTITARRVLDPQTRRTIYVGVGLLGAEGTSANRGAVEAQPPTDDLPDSLDDLADLFG